MLALPPNRRAGWNTPAMQPVLFPGCRNGQLKNALLLGYLRDMCLGRGQIIGRVKLTHLTQNESTICGRGSPPFCGRNSALVQKT